jgi:uncharacterized membrane protein YbhN (UPF0104 family)
VAIRVRVARATLALTLVGAALAVVLPRLVHAPWATIAQSWQRLTVLDLALLASLWLAGLVAHSWVMVAALPGLTRRRALTLNLTGSAVANVLPLGGGAGVALNYLMVRRWGFTGTEFSLFTAVSNAANVAMKALLPLVVVAAVVLADVELGTGVLLAVATAGAVLLLLLSSAALLFGSNRGLRVLARCAPHLPRRGRAHPRRDVTSSLTRLQDLRGRVAVLLRAGWPSMTCGMVAYYALQALLLEACMAQLGSTLSPGAVLVLFACERVLTAVPVTPGGSGVVEVTITALAMALGGSPAVSTAGVLLYRGFTFGLEIVVGAVWLLGWLAVRRASGSVVVPPLALPAGKAA